MDAPTRYRSAQASERRAEYSGAIRGQPGPVPGANSGQDGTGEEFLENPGARAAPRVIRHACHPVFVTPRRGGIH